ncbi:exported hypothetical protein [Gammaproteobacteria bacterium]
MFYPSLKFNGTARPIKAVLLTVGLILCACSMAEPPLAAAPNAQNEPVSKSDAAGHSELFGMIEIGSKGVKGIVIDLANADQDAGCQQSEEAFSECLHKSVRKQFEPFNVNSVDEGSIPDAAKAAKNLLDEMTGKYSVDVSRIYLVASSGISNRNLVPHRDRLQAAVEEALEQHVKMDFITSAQEGEFGFQGVLNLMPEKLRTLSKNQAVLLDIGSGDSKGGYLDERLAFIPYSVPWGTKSFTNEVNKTRGDENFVDVATKLRNSILRPAVHEEMDKKPGILTHNRVYLIGGIFWAVATLTQPENKQPFTEIRPEHFGALYDLVVVPESMTALCKDNKMQEVNPDLNKVCHTFDTNNLVAGLDILKTFAEEMRFSEKDVFFIRNSLYAWPFGYLKTRCKLENKCG